MVLIVIFSDPEGITSNKFPVDNLSLDPARFRDIMVTTLICQGSFC